MMSLAEANARFSREPCLVNKPEQINLSALADEKTRMGLEYFTLNLRKRQLPVPTSTAKC